MTIICSDGITIAGDGRCMVGSHIVCDDFCKIKVHGTPPRIYAISGLLSIFDALIDWHQAGANPADLPKLPGDKPGEWTLLVIDQDGPKTYHGEAPYPFSASYPLAIGCGQVYAISLLDAGLSPERALKLAFKREAYAGGEIQVVNISEALGLQSEPAPAGSITWTKEAAE